MTGLSTKLIDGAENNWPSYVTTGHYRAAPLLLADRAHDGARGAGRCREKAWDSLSPEDQAIFREAARESSRFMREQWRVVGGALARARPQLGGVTVVEDVDRAAFEAAMSGIYERSLTDPKIKSLVDRIRDTP